jgi:hypothetical protein
MPRKNSSTVAAQVSEQLASDDTLGIKEVVVLSGLSEQYVRKAIKSGKLPVTKGNVEGRKTPKNFINRADFEAWRNGAASHTRREDGRNKFVLYLTEDEAVTLIEKISGLPFAETLQRANLKKVAETEAA